MQPNNFFFYCQKGIILVRKINFLCANQNIVKRLGNYTSIFNFILKLIFTRLQDDETCIKENDVQKMYSSISNINKNQKNLDFEVL